MNLCLFTLKSCQFVSKNFENKLPIKNIERKSCLFIKFQLTRQETLTYVKIFKMKKLSEVVYEMIAIVEEMLFREHVER